MTPPPLAIERLALRLQQLPGVGVARLRRILGSIEFRKLSPGGFVSLPDDALLTVFGLNADAIIQLRQTTPLEAELWGKLVSNGISLVVQGTPSYPKRLKSLLGDEAPPLLFVKGDPAVLQSPGVGFCGSRKASEKGLSVARECSTEHCERLRSWGRFGRA